MTLRATNLKLLKGNSERVAKRPGAFSIFGGPSARKFCFVAKRLATGARSLAIKKLSFEKQLEKCDNRKPFSDDQKFPAGRGRENKEKIWAV